ncbi:hypothetical protein [Halalkalicoccus jeotgali]|uniref:Uncharacterized protein n=1 Tax=Halalkalicoccus jeotgali (strain DSM 18796 / CECT 7217 / JCM 14584 / KCTC 4019 / B3) TaxID=795797 RepID=D8JBU5_HALJB|nr:hypothetical protein [Halalkalicoccus jeotgali]ADJ16748.1 hypothetical protein HacjB3_16991 [Halalkalicoccus jeotgali B3]ELY40882.1 hypothetical protein C497_02327 [Halalkalicoccus jeotgali B3]
MQSVGAVGAANMLPNAVQAQDSPDEKPEESSDEDQSKSPKPTIATFAGPTATIMNAGIRITSNKARKKHDLPLLTGPDGETLDNQSYNENLILGYSQSNSNCLL